MAREIKVFKSDRWVTAKYKGSDEESADLAKLLYTMITDFNILTRIGFSKRHRRGSLHIEEIYEIVKSKLPGLCNDKCLEKKGYKNASKWKHVVRNALEELKDQKIIRSTNKHATYYFTGR